MAMHSLQDFIRRLSRARSVSEDGRLSDAQLLQRFVRQRDEAAFEVLVWRHGSLVLNVAGRLLGQAADIEDVFQATFLTLARKAPAIRRGTAVGSWLYKVAYRLALRVRRSAPRHSSAGLDAVAAPERPPTECDALLAEEISRLPERYRAAVVLCYLQGVTTEQAARILGCPRGTILSRLASARQRLRRRLLRRGVLPAVAATAVLFGEAASAAPSAVLVASVVGAALPFAAGRAALPTVSPHAALLAQGALQTMLWNKIKITVALLCVMILAGSGVGWLARPRAGVEIASADAAQPPAKKEQPPQAAAAEREDNLKSEIKKLHASLDMLADREQQLDGNKDIIEARMQLIRLEEELRQQELPWRLAREAGETRLKMMTNEIVRVEGHVTDLDIKAPKSEELKQAIKQLEVAKGMRDQQERKLTEIEKGYGEHLRSVREKMIRAEEDLRRLRARRAEQHEEYLARRQALQARIERLEDAMLHLPPADRLRDVERKLDALRREVNELRTSRERAKER